MIFGLDVLAAPKFEDLIVGEFPRGWNFGVFANVFGDARRVTARLFDTGRPNAARIQLRWSDIHRFTAADIIPTVREARKWKSLSREYKSRLQISSWCEHNAAAPLAAKVYDAVMNELPDCEYVNNPLKGALLPGVVNETHNESKRLRGRYNFSFDGTSAVDADVATVLVEHSLAECVYFWIPSFNLKKTVKDPTPRPERRVRPTSQGIDSTIYLATKKGVTKLDDDHIWKSHADQHDIPPENRAHKPVFLTPVKSQRAEIVADGGQVVAVSGPRMSPLDGRYRYYFSDFGFHLAEKAKRIQGHGVLKVRVGRQTIGTVNPAFRGGSYRE